MSVVIPALNEAGQVTATLERVQAARPKEIIVVDGGSRDDTASIAAEKGATVLASPPGRARQMNTGAAAASGAVLLFLHADTWPPEDCVKLAAGALGEPMAWWPERSPSRCASGCAEAGSWSGSPTRAAAAVICPTVTKDFSCAGNCSMRSPASPTGLCLEDVELLRRLKRVGRVVTLRPPVLTSARRWEQGGLLRTFARHQLILLGYAAGLSPHSLARWRR